MRNYLVLNISIYVCTILTICVKIKKNYTENNVSMIVLTYSAISVLPICLRNGTKSDLGPRTPGVKHSSLTLFVLGHLPRQFFNRRLMPISVKMRKTSRENKPRGEMSVF